MLTFTFPGMVLKPNLPRYPDPSRIDGGRWPQMATFREAGKSFDFYTFIIAIFGAVVKHGIKNG
jgi:hypothetical protein